MKIRSYFTFFLLLNSTIILKGQDLTIFEVNVIDYPKEKYGFVSLSDIAHLSPDPDSLVIPDLSEEEINAAQIIKLDSIFRIRFLYRTKIAETDKVFIYDYSTNLLLSYTVKNLDIVAYLNPYGADYPYYQSDYMIGFKLNKKYLASVGNDPTNTLVYIGKKNPFVQGQMSKIVWDEIESKDFPDVFNFKDTSQLSEYFGKELQYVIGGAYTYEKNGLQYFIQEILNVTDSEVLAKYLTVIDFKTKKIICRKNYFYGEGRSFTARNGQWTGNLFKDKSPVIFGFQNASFGCQGISFLDPNEVGIDINCDCRH